MDDYRNANAASLARLNLLLSRMGPNGLAHRLPNGWSVADVLVHLAFWDSYSLSLLQAWQNGHAPKKSANIDATNAAITALSHAIPPDAILALVLNTAEKVDRAVEAVSPALASTIAASEHSFLLFRCTHRNAHLQTLESELA